ncbi:MAG: type I DNA topoisomerase [Oscillospiraceae bacterium]|nr:type I DNA topoisomerase [Oscillospiraceae bacterium]
MSKLVILESPGKVKTVQKYLGSDYKVVASMGHIRDLPKSKMSIDFEHDFRPEYVEMKDKADIIKNLKEEASKADEVFLATDPDREGEAISWHLAYILDLPLNAKDRVTFNEITKSGVEAGMQSPRSIDLNLVNAQQARRLLDRIVGYKLSPFLWKKVRRGLSAGRVQSVAVRMIVDRERQIQNFKPEEYWSIEAKMTAPSSKKQFEAVFTGMDGEKTELHSEAETNAVLKRLEGAEYTVSEIKKSVRRKSPAPPFTTSTLQQEASKKLGFQTAKTMKTAQSLYEGVDIEGMGAVGLITYMRTDSLRISDEARNAAYKYIGDVYGKSYIPASPKIYKSKANAQDAHEAIRPSTPSITPDSIKGSLTTEQYKLYKLIWERFIASQMSNALLDTVSVDITANGCSFKATGFSVKFDGFTVLYEESKDDEENKVLPKIEKGDILKLKNIEGKQHFTQPPARYTEASFIKALEENGIGRPSTYAPTISTIINRLYVERDGKQLKPTALGEVTTDLMKNCFKKIVDTKFTAEMESDLDKVEIGEQNWVDTLREFYDDFDETLKKAEVTMEGKRVKVPVEETDEVCEVCGKPMVIKIGRFGRFLACSGFPDCTNTKKIVKDTGGVCPKCGKKVLQKKSKKGKKYYGCEDNPNCDFMTWDTPVSDKCPKCNDGTTLFKKGGKMFCLKEGCGYEVAIKKEK